MKIKSYEVLYYNTTGKLECTDTKRYHKKPNVPYEDLVKTVLPDARKSADTIMADNLIGFILIINTNEGRYIFHSEGIVPKENT